jgi:hypothetical protein
MNYLSKKILEHRKRVEDLSQQGIISGSLLEEFRRTTFRIVGKTTQSIDEYVSAIATETQLPIFRVHPTGEPFVGEERSLAELLKYTENSQALIYVAHPQFRPQNKMWPSSNRAIDNLLLWTINRKKHDIIIGTDGTLDDALAIRTPENHKIYIGAGEERPYARKSRD